ncbi:hypothetical protein [Acinetobacter guillouiae]|uniref:hypothetical protein n=1 Tax=Acinetobacter guillouiae TaxID=106649 RepID=UPI0026E3AD86|nr:hypothetical protein [Acinetobacter guillouiae]MDO6646513.1 hypothetical protein [Acinetobacter guillouiae]
MVKLVLLVDESGSKANSNKQENTIKEFGIMAGFIMYEDGYDFLKDFSKKIVKPLQEKYEKVHLTDFKFEDKKTTIDGFFKFFSESKCPWIYTAIYTQGFYDHHNANVDFDKNPPVFSMHSALFLENIIKLIAFVKDHHKNDCMNLEVKIVTDTIDIGTKKKIIQEFENIKPFFLNGKKETIKSFYNRKKEEVEHFVFEGIIDDENFSKIKMDSLSLEIIVDDDTAFMADILNYTLFKYVQGYIKGNKENNHIYLNSKSVVRKFELFENCYGYSDGVNLSFSDMAYFYRERK